MRIQSILLVWLVVIFPLNNITTYGHNGIIPEKTRTAVPQAFDLAPETDSPSGENSLIEEYIDAFKVISPEAIKYALSGYAYLDEQNRLCKKDIITIVDFSKPSTQERLYVVNLKTKQILAKSLVAHGRNSGEVYANKFSNSSESYQSSLGFYVASETYDGKHGYSLKLDGMEAGFNSNARDRGVVVHGADYVSYNFINATGRLGRSQGCPALPMSNYQQIISLIKGGSCFFIYHPNKYYLAHSPILKNYNESSLADVVSSVTSVN